MIIYVLVITNTEYILYLILLVTDSTVVQFQNFETLITVTTLL